MPIYFSIVPPPIGTENLKCLLIPNIEEIVKFSQGDLGISDSIRSEFLYKVASIGKYPTNESANLFSNFGGFKTENSIESYRRDGSDRITIPREDFSVDGNDSMGLKPMEKTIIQSIFETQKPYMEYVPTMVKVLGKLEIIAAKVLGTFDISRKPKYNERSLTYKLNLSTKELDQMTNFSKKRSENFKDLTTSDKIKGGVDLISDLIASKSTREESFSKGNLNDFEWEIISTEYSTGSYIKGVSYKEIYRNIIDPTLVLDSTKVPSEIVLDESKPPTVIFGYYNVNGDPINPPTQWLNRQYEPNSVGPSVTKWYGEWEQLEDNDRPRYLRFLREYIDDRLFKKIRRRDVDLSNRLFNFIEPKIDSSKFIEKANEFCFMNLINKTGEDGLGLGDDSSDEVQRITKDRKKMFLPKKINFNGNQVIIDPESDYELQIIKLVPIKDVYYNGSVDRENQNLKKTTPLVGNYMGVNVRDTLTKDQYDIPGYNVSKPTEGVPRRIQTANKYRYDISDSFNSVIWDNQINYVIEGILRTNPDKENENSKNGNDRNLDIGNPLGWYGKWGIFSAVKDFIDILINIFLDLIPEIDSLIKLYSSPHEFIFDTIFEKMENNFAAFSSTLMTKYRSLEDFDDRFEKKKFIESDPDLSKFVFLDEDLNHRFVLDGFSGMELLGFNFGVNIIDFLPKLVLEKTNNFSLNQSKESINGNSLSTQPRNMVTGDNEKGDSLGTNPNGDVVNANVRKKKDDGTYEWETVSVQYSTGDFIKGVDYNYIYITEDVERLLSKGDELFEAAIQSSQRGNGGLGDAIDSLTNYNMALDKDPNNNFIKNKIDELKTKFKLNIQTILQFLMNMVSFPMKIVISILEEFKKFFTNIVKLVTIPDVLKELLTFDWIKKYVKPTAIMEFIGLRFNPELLFTWLAQIKSPNFDPDFEFDLNEIVGSPFLFKLPKVNKSQLQIMGTKPLEMMTSVFKLVQMLIEKILCFIFNTLSIDKIMDCPKFEISKFASANLPLEDLQAILNGESSMLNSDPGNSENGNTQNTSGSDGDDVPYKFLYNVKLSDGTVIKDLNYAELQNFIRDNNEFNYEVKY